MKTTKPSTLTPLKVGIYDNNKLVRVVEIPDPRILFVKYWKRLYPKGNSVARPLPAPRKRKGGAS